MKSLDINRTTIMKKQPILVGDVLDKGGYDDDFRVKNANIAFYGCGAMGYAILKSILERGGIDSKNIFVIDRNPKPFLLSLKDSFDFILVSSPDELDSEYKFDVLLLAVKPQGVEHLLEQRKCFFDRCRGIVSVLAGKDLDFFGSCLGKSFPVVRAMPNVAVEFGFGFSALIANDTANNDNMFIKICHDIFKLGGKVAWVEEEANIDTISSMSGSGPAYIFYLAEVIANIGIKKGLSEEEAFSIAEAVVIGAGEILKNYTVDIMSKSSSNEKQSLVQEARSRISSKGGSTQAAMQVLTDQENGLENLFEKALSAAIKRSKELGS